MNASLRAFAPVGLVVFSSFLHGQVTRQVPSQFSTIQSAINASASGDTIVVAAGTYFETLDTGTKSLTLRAPAGPLATIVDAANTGRVLKMSAASTVEGFTFTRGRSPDGVPTSAGQDGEDGGGILMDGPTVGTTYNIRGCIVLNCAAGNGVNYTQGNLFIFVTTPGDGGDGGGIAVRTYGNVNIDRCIVFGNVSGTASTAPGSSVNPSSTRGEHGRGGGIYVGDGTSGTVTISNTLVYGNTATSMSPISLSPPNPDGGGIGVGTSIAAFISGAPIRITNSTIVGNFCYPGQCGGIATLWSNTIIRNCIVASNTGVQIGANGNQPLASATTNVPMVTYCDVFPGGAPGIGNVGMNPLLDAASDYRLLPTSPCINAGTTPLISLTVDLGGAPRFYGPARDIGAHEYVPRLAGTNESFTLGTLVDGIGNRDVGVKAMPAGRVLGITYSSPNGTFAGAIAGLAAESFPTGMPLTVSNPIFPELHLDTPSAILIDGPIFLPAFGMTLSNMIPPGLAGLTVRLQAFALMPQAQNGILALSDAHDLVFI